MLEASEQVQGKISELQKQIDVAPPEQREELVRAQSLFKQKLDQLQVDGALKQGGAQLVTPAVTPTTAVSPRPLRNGLLALFVGLLLGICLAFLLNYLDDSVRTKDDFERVAPGPAGARHDPRGQRLEDEGPTVPRVDPRPDVAGGGGLPHPAYLGAVPRARPADAESCS